MKTIPDAELCAGVATFLMSAGHFYDCMPGKRGTPPGATCSLACINLRGTIDRAQAILDALKGDTP